MDTEHTSVSSSSFIYTRSNLEFTRENIIHTNIQINNDIIQVVNNNINQFLDPKIHKKSAAATNRSQLSKHHAMYMIAEKQSHDQKYSH